jgi:hypothetical protein
MLQRRWQGKGQDSKAPALRFAFQMMIDKG